MVGSPPQHPPITCVGPQQHMQLEPRSMWPECSSAREDALRLRRSYGVMSVMHRLPPTPGETCPSLRRTSPRTCLHLATACLLAADPSSPPALPLGPVVCADFRHPDWRDGWSRGQGSRGQSCHSPSAAGTGAELGSGAGRRRMERARAPAQSCNTAGKTAQSQRTPCVPLVGANARIQPRVGRRLPFVPVRATGWIRHAPRHAEQGTRGGHRQARQCAG